MRVGTFDTLSKSFVNNVNKCLKIHSRHQSHKKSTINNVDEWTTERWFDGTINRIFKLLKLDEPTHFRGGGGGIRPQFLGKLGLELGVQKARHIGGSFSEVSEFLHLLRSVRRPRP